MKWWNAVTEIRVPFDTRDEAIAGTVTDEQYAILIELFGEDALVGGHIEEVEEES